MGGGRDASVCGWQGMLSSVRNFNDFFAHHLSVLNTITSSLSLNLKNITMLHNLEHVQ